MIRTRAGQLVETNSEAGRHFQAHGAVAHRHGPPSPSPLMFLRRRQVLSICGVSTSTLYAMVAKGTFPRPVRLTPGLVGWVAAEVDEWMAARVAERDAKGTKEVNVEQ